MKLCVIQPLYPYTIEEADENFNFIINSLNKCVSDIDLILLPEYSNAPTAFSEGQCIPYAIAHTDALIEAVIATAKRCKAIVAVNYAAEINGEYRNTTRVYDRHGDFVGDYYKQHLPNSETKVKLMADAYTYDYNPPKILEIDGIRLGFLTCYDCYFNEYIEHIAAKNPDIVLVSSHQRSERPDIIEMQTKSLAFNCNAFVLRAAVSMGKDNPLGGCSMVADPSGKILADYGQQVGTFCHEIDSPHYKYQRTNGFGGQPILNNKFIQQGRTPWCYRACGSMVKANDEQMPYPRVCAHRGFNTIAPENSLPAFGAAIALGAEEIELDVWETKDGVLVVCHDPSVERISNGSGIITEMNFEDIHNLDFGETYSKQFKGLRIATLEDIFKAFSRQTIINLHIKSSGEEYFSREIVKKIADLIYKYDFAEHIYITARQDVLEAALEVAPKIKRCMAAGLAPNEIVENAIKYKCSKLQFMKPYFSQSMIDKAHAHKIRCNMFWSDTPSEARKMLQMGIDTILTNDYLAIANVLYDFKIVSITQPL